MSALRQFLPGAAVAGSTALALWYRRREWASRRRFRALADAGSALIRQDDVSGNAIYFNEPWLAFTHRTREELLGQGWLADVHPEDRGNLIASNRLASRTQSQKTVEYRLRRHDGEYRWMIEHSSPYRLEHGEISGSLSSLIDISGRKRAEAGLRLLASTGAVITSSLDSDQMLERFARHVTQGFADWCVVHLMREDQLELAAVATARSNHAAALSKALPTLRRCELINSVLEERDPVLFVRGSSPNFEQTVADLGLARAVPGIEIESLVLAPMTVRGRVIGTLLLTSQHASRRFDSEDIGLVRSLAQRLSVVVENARLFEEVQAAEERYRRFFSGSADAIVVADQSLIVRETNPAFEQLFGARQTRVIGQRITEVLSLPDDARIAIIDPEAIHDWRGDLTLSRADGEPIMVEAWLGQLAVPEGPIVVAALRDISERTRFESSRRRLLASVSHDLKNPLNSIKANAQLAIRQLNRGSIDTAQAIGVFQRIDGLTNRMVRQIADLMDVALLESGSQLELELREVELVSLTREVVDQYQATTSEHQIDVSTRHEAIIGHWDGHRIERVLTNLLTNAIKYSPGGGSIVFTLYETTRDGEPWVGISLSDQGIGIEPDDLPTLFTRIGRGRNVADRFSGTGIGLVGVSQIVRQHGGTIEVESTPGQGSTFRIMLPCSTPVIARSESSGAMSVE